MLGYYVLPYDIQHIKAKESSKLPQGKKKFCTTYEKRKKTQIIHGALFTNLNLRRKNYLQGKLLSSFESNIINTKIRGKSKKIDSLFALDISRSPCTIEDEIVPRDSTALKFALDRIDKIVEGDDELLLTITRIFNQRIGCDLNWLVLASIDSITTGFLPFEDTSKRHYKLYKKNGYVYIEGSYAGILRDTNKNFKLLPIKFFTIVRYNLNTDKAFHVIRFRN